jgi:hypothetical protein
MSLFDSIAFDLHAAEIELRGFKGWLADRTFLGEKEIVAEIAARPQMMCLLGVALRVPRPDMIKFELTMKGVFRTDLVVGNDHSRTFALIEFEAAEETSLFRRGTAQYRHWGSALEHGFGQVIDWAWVRDDHPNDTVLHAAFGGAIAHSIFAVVCGRDAGIVGPMEHRRFAHRRHLVTIAGHSAEIMTYDDMVRRIEENLAMLAGYIQTP